MGEHGCCACPENDEGYGPATEDDQTSDDGRRVEQPTRSKNEYGVDVSAGVDRYKSQHPHEQGDRS